MLMFLFGLFAVVQALEEITINTTCTAYMQALPCATQINLVEQDNEYDTWPTQTCTGTPVGEDNALFDYTFWSNHNNEHGSAAFGVPFYRHDDRPVVEATISFNVTRINFPRLYDGNGVLYISVGTKPDPSLVPNNPMGEEGHTLKARPPLKVLPEWCLFSHIAPKPLGIPLVNQEAGTWSVKVTDNLVGTTGHVYAHFYIYTAKCLSSVWSPEYCVNLNIATSSILLHLSVN
jgi:hypothetical protein